MSRAAASSRIAERAAAARDALRRRGGRDRGGSGRGSGGGGGAGGGGPASPGGGDFRRRRILALVGVVAGLLLLWFLVALFQPFAGDGQGEGTVSVTIPEGASAGEIADILDEHGVVSSGSLFALRLRFAGKAGDIQADTYTLAQGMSYGAAIDRLTGEAEGLPSVVIPEGLSREEVAELVADAGIEGDYLAASQSFDGFNPRRYGVRNPDSLEGFLFPATYDLSAGAPAQDLVQLQLQAFQQQFADVDMRHARSKNLTAYDVLIIASMIEREVRVPDERPLVAAVIYNRLSEGIPLGIDATVRYAVGNHTEPLTNEELRDDSPYNTRLHQGLPPGPIGNPGIESIRAAARPADAPYLYYVFKPGTCGEHTFARTEAEFEQAVAEYNRAREAAGGQSPEVCD